MPSRRDTLRPHLGNVFSSATFWTAVGSVAAVLGLVIPLVVRKGKSEGGAQLRQKQYAAYRLGQDLTSQVMTLKLVGKGSPDEIAQVKEEALILVAVSQGLADRLELKLDLPALVKAGVVVSKSMSLLGSSVFDIVDERIGTIHGKSVLAAFNAGKFLTFLHFEAGVTMLKGGEDLAEILATYPQIAAGIQEDLGKIGLREQLAVSVSTAEQISAESQRMRRAVEKFLTT